MLNGAFLVIELVVGWWSGSLALLSDGAHMVSDVGALVLALGAAQLATRRPSTAMTYGLGRAEVLGAFLNGLLLVGACGWIVFEAVERLVHGAPEVPGMAVLVTGFVGLVINLASAWYLHRSDDQGLNTRGALLHMLGDALGSVAAMVSAGFLLVGVPAADPVASLVVAALVAVGAWALLRDAGTVLLELPPPGLDVDGVRDALLELDGVSEVHDLHAWTLDGRTPIVSAHLVLGEGAAFEGVCGAAHRLLHDRFDIEHATVQPERGNGCHTDCGVHRTSSTHPDAGAAAPPA